MLCIPYCCIRCIQSQPVNLWSGIQRICQAYIPCKAGPNESGLRLVFFFIQQCQLAAEHSTANQFIGLKMVDYIPKPL